MALGGIFRGSYGSEKRSKLGSWESGGEESGVALNQWSERGGGTKKQPIHREVNMKGRYWSERGGVGS